MGVSSYDLPGFKPEQKKKKKKKYKVLERRGFVIWWYVCKYCLLGVFWGWCLGGWFLPLPFGQYFHLTCCGSVDKMIFSKLFNGQIQQIKPWWMWLELTTNPFWYRPIGVAFFGAFWREGICGVVLSIAAVTGGALYGSSDMGPFFQKQNRPNHLGGHRAISLISCFPSNSLPLRPLILSLNRDRGASPRCGIPK